ncbi:hypothetical protein BKA61DRAFT_667314 [Leptodontidium sp. MPI-SDFR-AT-0119]|nr:hypothetical protein BKA61DRAFT_667314 [Leptodontidium sp. MPI-SDFR-AT-0119]
MPCEACLTIPPVIKDNYKPKGSYSTIAGLKTYITGPANETKAIVGFYDIFAHIPQTLQGADILATALNAQVIIPDLLEGHYAKVDWYLPTAGEKDFKDKADYFADVFQCHKYLPKFNEFIKSYPGGITTWGSYGLCWGAKIVAMTSGKDTVWKVSAQAHPSELDAAEVKQIEIPHIILASEREDLDVVAECKRFLEVERKTGVVDTYGTQLHGWMAARADLADENIRKEYLRGYTQLAEFFHKNL